MVTYEELLLPLVAIEVVLPRINVPTSRFITVDAVKIVFTDIAAPVVLCQECAISLLPGFVLYFRSDEVLSQRWQRSILDICSGVREGHVVEAPESPKFAECRKGVVDKVLVRPVETVVDHPVHVTFGGCELDVDVIGALVNHRGG